MAQTTGPGTFFKDDSPETVGFLTRHGEVLGHISDAIDQAFTDHDGNTILLLDASLRGMVVRIHERVEAGEVRFEVDTDKG